MNQYSNFSQTPSKKPVRFPQPQNFAEALKSVGGYAVDQTTKKSYPSTETSQGHQEHRRQEEEHRLHEIKRRRHQEVTAQPIYDRRDAEIKQAINEIRQELKALAKELSGLSLSLQKAIDEEIAQPGTYHLAFFEKLKSFLIQFRKKVADSKSWLELSSQRKATRNAYWGNVKKSGTKYMLSSERTLATQTG